MNSLLKDRTALLALITTEIMILVTSIHHVYRLGAEMLVPAVGLLAIPILLAWWCSRIPSRLSSVVYAAYAGVVFFYFGIIDGFSDHVLKALGLDNTTFLPGSDAAVIQTVFHLWSQEAGQIFYETTGILTFVFGLVAMFFTYRLVRRAPTKTPAAPITVTNMG